MDRSAHLQIQSFWADVADHFAELIPHGMRLVRTEDLWSAEHGLRRRTVELTPRPDAPSLEDLRDEAFQDALYVGWTELEEGRFELEDVHLSVEPGQIELATGVYLTLRFTFDQPWPEDAGAPVQTSESFQNLARRLLRLSGDPVALEKEVVVDSELDFSADELRELVRLYPCDQDLTSRFSELDFTPAEDGSESWISTSQNELHDYWGRVRKLGRTVELELIKKKRIRAKS